MADSNGEQKDGKECFRELLRLMPTAKSEDYLKNGRWLMDLLAMDTDLIIAHRRESGAPEPPPIEEIELPPELQRSSVPSRATYAGAAAAAKPGPTSTIKPLAPVGLAKPPLKPASLLSSARPSPSSTTPSSSLASAAQPELRMIATFVQKWQLDPTRTKLLLAKLTPTRRKAVIEDFSFSSSNGVTPTVALERYIQQNETSVGLGRPAPKPASGPRPASAPSGPVKRPLSSMSSVSAGGDAKKLNAGNGATGPSRVTNPKASGMSAKPGDLIKNLLGGL